MAQDVSDWLNTRTLHYKRNALVVSTIIVAVHWAGSAIGDAKMFNISFDENEIWALLLIFLTWNCGFAALYGYEDFDVWRKDAAGSFPNLKTIRTKFQIGAEQKVRGETWKLREREGELQWTEIEEEAGQKRPREKRPTFTERLRERAARTYWRMWIEICPPACLAAYALYVGLSELLCQ